MKKFFNKEIKLWQVCLFVVSVAAACSYGLEQNYVQKGKSLNEYVAENYVSKSTLEGCEVTAKTIELELQETRWKLKRSEQLVEKAKVLVSELQRCGIGIQECARQLQQCRRK